jgi:hypothetical protein
MTITLSNGTTTVTLPADLEWVDEYDWLPVEQSADYSVTGALIIDVGARQSGRPITLSGNDSTAWLTRSQVDALRVWAAIAGQALTLTLADARVFAVAFRHQDAPALEAAPVAFTAPMQSGDWYVITLKFMEL